MKSRVTIIGISLLVIAVAIVGWALFVRWPVPFNDTHQRKFAVDAGFLSSSDESLSAIIHYARALRILEAQGRTSEGASAFVEGDKTAKDSVGDVNEILALVLEGAKLKDLGVGSLKDDALGIDILDYGDIRFSDFTILAKSLAEVARTDLNRGGRLDRVLLIGRVNIAIGVQFTDEDNIAAHLVGLVFKREGLGILEAYSETPAGPDLRQSVHKMRREFEKERHEAKRRLRNM